MSESGIRIVYLIMQTCGEDYLKMDFFNRSDT